MNSPYVVGISDGKPIMALQLHPLGHAPFPKWPLGPFLRVSGQRFDVLMGPEVGSGVGFHATCGPVLERVFGIW